MNLFDLSAKISLDMGNLERNLTDAQKRVLALERELEKLNAKSKQTSKSAGGLSDVMRGLTSTTTTLQGPLGGIAGRFSSLGTLTSALTSPMAVLGVSIGALAVVSVAAGVGIYKLVLASAEATGQLHDLSQQTGFSVETLSALKNAAETSGGSIQSITSALFLFETKMGEAKDKTSEMSNIFKVLKIDTENNEKALRQAITAILGMTNAEDQATLGKKLFGRSVKDLMGAIKEAGSLDAFLNAQMAAGLIITTDAARAGDKLSDSVTILGQRFSAAGREVANEFAPQVTAAIEEVDRWLIDNKATIIDWASAFASGTSSAASAFATFGSVVSEIAVGVIASLNSILAALSALDESGLHKQGTNFYDKYRVGPGGNPPPVPMWTPEGEFVSPGSRNDKGGVGTRTSLGNLLSGKGRGGGGGGGVKTDPSVAFIQRLESELAKLSDAYNDVDTSTKMYAVTQEIATGALKKAKLETQDLAKILARDFDRATQQTQAKKDLTDFQKQQNEAVREALYGEKSYFDVVTELIKAQEKLGEILDDSTVFWLNQSAAILASQRALKMYADTLEPIMLPGAAGEGLTDDQIGQRAGAAADRAAGAPPPNYHQQLLDFQERMRNLAYDLTNTISNALSDGFENGIAAGLSSFGEGILEMIQSDALNALEKRLADVFANALGSSGGRGFMGWLLKILGIALPAVAGAGVGSIGASGAGTTGHAGFFPHAMGLNYVPYDNYPAMLHRGERVVPALENKSGGGGEVHHHYSPTININVPNIALAGSGATQAQVARQYSAMLQKHALITG